MKSAAIFSVLLAVVLWMGSAIAVPPGKSIEFAGGALGKVTLDGKTHAEKAKCPDCHPKVFQMKKGATKFKMADINAGKACGVCHDGKKAFKANDPANCTKCHKK